MPSSASASSRASKVRSATTTRLRLDLPAVTKRAIDKFRRVVPRRKPAKTIEISKIAAAAGERSATTPGAAGRNDKGHDA